MSDHSRTNFSRDSFKTKPITDPRGRKPGSGCKYRLPALSTTSKVEVRTDFVAFAPPRRLEGAVGGWGEAAVVEEGEVGEVGVEVAAEEEDLEGVDKGAMGTTTPRGR